MEPLGRRVSATECSTGLGPTLLTASPASPQLRLAGEGFRGLPGSGGKPRLVATEPAEPLALDPRVTGRELRTEALIGRVPSRTGGVIAELQPQPGLASADDHLSAQRLTPLAGSSVPDEQESNRIRADPTIDL